MAIWTDGSGTTWELKDGKPNFNEWATSRFADKFADAAVKWNAGGDVADMHALFNVWVNAVGAVKQ